MDFPLTSKYCPGLERKAESCGLEGGEFLADDEQRVHEVRRQTTEIGSCSEEKWGKWDSISGMILWRAVEMGNDTWGGIPTLHEETYKAGTE